MNENARSEVRLIQRVQELRLELENALSEVNGKFPVSDYIAALDADERQGNYRHIPKTVYRICKLIEASTSSKTLERYHKLVLIVLICDFRTRLTRFNSGDVQLEELLDYLAMVVREIESNATDYFVHGNDRFAKNLAVCRLKMIPFGPLLADISYGGIERRNFFLFNIKELYDCLKFVFYKVGSYRNFIELHLDTRLIKKLSPEEVKKAYLNMSNILTSRPELNGILASRSWMFDPVLERISPELVYLRELPQNNGALLIRCSFTKSRDEDAIRFSPVRKKLYECGKYKPKNYMFVWHSVDVLSWVKLQS